MAIRNILTTILLCFTLPFFSYAQSNYTLINDATQYNGCHCYQLTADVGNEGGGVYQNNTINLNNSFDYKFSVFLGCNGSSGADGMTFILTNNITQIGAQGGGLGYSGLAGNSLAVEYDTYQNSWDPPYNHMALEYGGQVQHPTGTLVGPVPALTSQANIDDCAWHTTEVIWNANTHTYTAYFDGVLRLTYTNDIVTNYFAGNPIVNWGWSGSTGGSEDQQIFCINSISSWVVGNNYQSCNPTLQFSDISTSNVSTIQSWDWNFGDPASGGNNISSLQDPTHTFSSTGTFNVTLIITDISGCQDTFSHSVTVDPPIALAPTLTDPLCNGGYNGSIDLTASGGFGVSAGYGGYAYTWSNGGTSANEIGVTAGTYNVTVTDGICTTTASYTVNQPTALSATTSATDASCGLNNGSVTIAISGGTPPYQNVTWDGVPGYTSTGLAPGTYVANFTDANGCSALLSYTATVSSLPCGYTVSTSSTNVSCFGGSNGSVTLSVTGGVGPVTISWTNSVGTVVGTTATVNNLPAGTYTYHYTDGVPTSFTGTVVVTQPGGALTIGLVTTNPSCSYLNNGTAVASIIANGTPNYAYAWSVPEPNSPTATGLSPGNITVTVTDANGCTATATDSVHPQSALIANVSLINDSCYHLNDGSATVTVSGGHPNYTYLWSNTAIGSTNYGLDSGRYTVTVTDQNSCTTTAVANITQPPLLVATISDSNVACFGGATGTATVTPSGGNGGYSYIWSNSSTAATTSGLSANTYYVTVTDNKNCKGVDTLTITQPAAAIAVSDSQVNVKCKGSATGSVTLYITGGSPAYSVTWAGGATGTTRTNLSAGTYTYTVTDAHLCTYLGSVTITEPLLPFMISVAQTNVSCFGGNNGAITLTPSGGTLPYAFAPLWLDGFIGYTRTNLTAGTYYYADSDANGCIDTGRVVITQPNPLVADTISTSAISCFGGNNGAITIGVSGGTYPYIYIWTSLSITDSLGINLSAGTDTIYVTDAHGCKDTLAVTIGQPTPILPVIVSTDSVTCFGGNNGSVTVSAGGGTSPYTYALDGSASYQGSGTFTGLSAGSHSVTVKDAHGCDSTISFTIYQPTQIAPSIIYTTNASCNGTCNGTIAVSATGGISPYTFSDDGTNYSAVDSFTSLCAGNYTLYVKDANGCIQSITNSVTQPAALQLSVTNITEPSCFGNSNGQITVTATGGTPAYLYSIDLGFPQLSGTFTGLSAGLHIIGVGDSHICLDTIHVFLNQPNPLVADTISTTGISCFGSNNGTITIGVSGGTYPYNYVWPQAPGITDSLGINLSAGSDTIYITDANGCKDTVTATLSQPSKLAPFAVSMDSVSCFGGNNGSITVNANGGTAPYSFALDGSATYQASGTFTGLSAGPHTITVKDANGCDSIFPINIYQPAVLTPTITYTTNASCNGSCNGAIAISATGGTNPYTYSKDGTNYSVVDSFTGLCQGNYTLYVKDFKGCVQTITDVITQPTVLTLAVADTIDPTCYNGTTGHIAVTAAGGTPVYTYSLDGGTAQGADSFTTVGGGAHTITVTDAHGCSQTVNLSLGQPTQVITDTVSTEQDTCYGSSNGAIYLTTNGGFGPYTYAWQNPASNTTDSATGLAAGSYTAVITDSHGCQETVTYTITQPEQPILSILPGDTTIGFGDTIQLFTQFGPASLGTPSVYSWTADPSGTLSCLNCPVPYMTSNDSINTYSVQVTYNNNLCTATATVTIKVTALDTFAVADAFTPNGDGINDKYIIQAKEVKNFHMDIFDRWGQTVFSTDDITQGWDGTYKGKPQPQGMYTVFFSLQYGQNKSVQKTSGLMLFR
jgi:gliding motility-associated-like protein